MEICTALSRNDMQEDGQLDQRTEPLATMVYHTYLSQNTDSTSTATRPLCTEDDTALLAAHVLLVLLAPLLRHNPTQIGLQR